jgi:putative colanic acid biosynthesis acetyltransferase WcaF
MSRSSAPSAPASSAPEAGDPQVSPYSTREKVARLLWAATQATLFRLSFHTWNRWRIWLINCFGGRMHKSCMIRRTVRIECPWNLETGRNCSFGDRAILYCLGPVRLGDRVSISQHVHVCAGSHDYRRPDLPLLRLPITIENDAWIAADAFLGPGIQVREGAILGARGAAFSDLEPWTIYGGNPARPLKPRPRFDSSSG